MTKRTDIDPIGAQPRNSKDGLTPRRRAFVKHYIATLNGAEAARRAGYSVKGADAEAAWLLTVPRVMEAIEREVAASVPLLRARVVEETAALAFANLADYVEFDGGGHSIEVLEDGTTVVTEHPRVKIKDSKQLTRRETAAIRKISERVSQSGARTVDFELHAKDASLDRLAKLLNMLPREGSALLPGDDREVREIKITYATAPSLITEEP